jgi:hypothetical protein
MSRPRRGRPPRDRLQLMAEIVAAREADPAVSIRALSRELRVRRETVRQAVRALEAARGRVPNCESGRRGAEGEAS